MAHECDECGMTCHCGGDIDDIHWGVSVDCQCAYSSWGCGKYDDEDWDEDDWDMEEEMYYQVKLNQDENNRDNNQL